MNTAHILETEGHPLEAVRKLLAALWAESNLQGMLVPAYQVDTMQIQHRLLQSPEQLVDLNPFVPFIPVNAAKTVNKIAAENPALHCGAVLRPCEARALLCNTGFGFKNRHHWLLIGVDCLASFPIQDLEWRTERAGGIEALSKETLRFAHQGGIASYRYRTACQMCIPTAPRYVDINISLIGLPVRRLILIEIKRKDDADRLKIDRFTSRSAPSELLEQREATLSRLVSRHRGTRTRLINSLPVELPSNPDDLVVYLHNCAPCQSCLEACPIYEGELANRGKGKYTASAETRRWLASCVLCGMCEQACPRNIALTALHGRISLQLAVPLKSA